MAIFDPSASAAGSAAGSGGGVFKLKAGAAIFANDLLQLGPNGKAFPVKSTDYAAVANCNYGTAQTSAATGQIVAQTQITSAHTLAQYRQAVLQVDDGSIFTLTGRSSLVLTKYSASGAFISSVAVDNSIADYYSHQILRLSNGNIAVISGASVASAIKFAIYDHNLNVVKSVTGTAETSNAEYFSACALAGGGFAIVYQQSANPLLSRFVTYDNAGTAVLAPTTIWTRTGSSGNQYHRMAQLSNGNLAVAVFSANTSGSIGLFYGIVSTAGASVKAFASLDSVSNAWLPELSVIADYFCIAKGNGATQFAYVFNNSGILQGSAFSAATAAGATANNLIKLLNDGTDFYLIWPRSSDSKEVLTKLPVSGTGYVTTVITPSGASNYNKPVDAFVEYGLICAIFADYLVVINASTGQLVSSVVTDVSTVADMSYPRVIPGGDFSFIHMYESPSGSGTTLYVGKYANTAIMGVAQSDAVADALVEVASPAGGYAANYIKGSPSKAFDHSATNIIGNKGALLNYGAVLKGF